MNHIEAKGLSAGSLYKLLFAGLFPLIFLFCISCGIAGFFGYNTVSINGVYVYGFKAVLAAFILGIALPALLSAFLWIIMIVGLWLWSHVRKITLTIKE